MAYSGISIQSKGRSAITAANDVQTLRDAGVQTLGVQIKPTQYKKEYPKVTWDQALVLELNWALAIVEACNDPELRKIKVVIRFNDLVSTDDSLTLEMNSVEWWNDYTSVSLVFWERVCQKFVGQEIYMFEIYSEPARVDNRPDSPYPIKSELENFYQEALNIVRAYNSDSYFLLSPGPFGKYVQYLNGFTPFNIIDSVRPHKLMYGFHMYVEHKYTHQGIGNSHRPETYPSATFDANKMNLDFAEIAAWSLQYGYPIYMGEFNAVRYSPNAQEWVGDVIFNAKHFKINWSFFAFMPFWEGWDPYWDVDNPDDFAGNWHLAYVGPSTSLWKFLLTQF